MESILATLASKIGWVGFGAAVPLVLILARKQLPKMAGKWVAGLLGDGLGALDKITDPKEKELVHAIAVAVVKWAEYKIPEKGAGRARYEAAAQKLCALLPFLKGRDADIATIIENAVAAMDDELKKAAEANASKAIAEPK